MKMLKKFMNGRDITPFIYAGQVVSAIETDKGNVYYGVCVDAVCNWGTCAERSAVFNMITHGESKIVKVLTFKDGVMRMPCGICREALIQLDKCNENTEILVDLEIEKTIKLKDLIPHWWGRDRF